MTLSYIQQQYITIGKPKITFGSTEADGFAQGQVIMEDSKYWTAELTFYDSSLYPSTATYGTTVTVEITDAGGTYKTLFSGTVLYPTFSFGDESHITFQCVGKGYALNMMNCAEEYGVQSRNPAHDAIEDILTNSSVGVIPKWVNKYKATAYDSGYNISTTYVENLSGSIPYIVSPWKPADKFLGDLCDLHTAISQSNSLAGPHWIIDHSGNLRLKRIGASQTGWTKYYGNSQANATLTNGEDFFDGDFQPVGVEANVVLYSGVWRRPSSGDAWTEDTATSWGKDNENDQLTDESSIKMVGNYSIKFTAKHAPGNYLVYYPSAKNLGLDLTVFPEFNVPTLQFYLRCTSSVTDVVIHLVESDTKYFWLTLTLPAADTWQHYTLPLGTYYKTKDSSITWSEAISPSWANINSIQFYFNGGMDEELYIDGLQIGDTKIIRVARQEFPDEIQTGRGTLGTSTNPVRFKVFTDNIGKDDSLNASDDSGLNAQLVKAELLRLAKPTVNGKFSIPLIPDVLPGQYFYIGQDYRITKVTHVLGSELRSHFEVTDDLTNTRPRLRYEDLNKIQEANRPGYQDRQATSIKGDIDIRVTPLEKAYNI